MQHLSTLTIVTLIQSSLSFACTYICPAFHGRFASGCSSVTPLTLKMFFKNPFLPTWTLPVISSEQLKFLLCPMISAPLRFTHTGLLCVSHTCHILAISSSCSHFFSHYFFVWFLLGIDLAMRIHIAISRERATRAGLLKVELIIL